MFISTYKVHLMKRKCKICLQFPVLSLEFYCTSIAIREVFATNDRMDTKKAGLHAPLEVRHY